jgi:hypothetical protein
MESELPPFAVLELLATAMSPVEIVGTSGEYILSGFKRPERGEAIKQSGHTPESCIE